MEFRRVDALPPYVFAEIDKVKVELSPYDLTRGRITWREKNV